MRTKVTLVLIFLNVALFYAIFFLRDDFKGATDTTSILGAEVSNIQTLSVTNASGETLTRLEQRAGKWLLTQPLAWPASETAVRNIITELQFLRPITTFTVEEFEKNGQTLADISLAPAALTLSFSTAPSPDNPAPAPVLVRIGKPTDVANRLYILSPDGQRIHVVPRSLAESLYRSLQSLRSDELFNIFVYEARSLVLETSPSSRVRFRRENDKWFIDGLSRANKQLTELAIGDLRSLRVHSFVNPDSPEAANARTAFANPALRITLQGNNRRETLILGRPAPADPDAETATDTETPPEPAKLYYAIMEGEETGGPSAASATLFTVSITDKFLHGTLLNAQRVLREKQILDLDPAALSSITIVSPDSPQELVLQRLDTSNVWQTVVRVPGREVRTEPADTALVENLIASLLRLSVEDTPASPGFIDVASEAQKEEFGFNRPARTVTFTTTGSPAQPPVRLLIASSQDQRTYARLASQEYIYRIDGEILRELSTDPLHYRKRELRDLPAIAALKLTGLGATETVLLETPYPLPEDSPLNRSAIDTLVAQLRNLRAKNFVSGEFTRTVTTAGEERPWKYRLDATLASTGAGATPATSTLFIADRAGGGIQLVGSTDLNAVFEAEQPLIDALFALTYGSRDPGPTPPPPAPTPAP